MHFLLNHNRINYNWVIHANRYKIFADFNVQHKIQTIFFPVVWFKFILTCSQRNKNKLSICLPKGVYVHYTATATIHSILHNVYVCNKKRMKCDLFELTLNFSEKIRKRKREKEKITFSQLNTFE